MDGRVMDPLDEFYLWLEAHGLLDEFMGDDDDRMFEIIERWVGHVDD